MAKKKLIEIKKGKCIAALLHVLIELKRASPSKWGFLIKLNLIKRCILNFEKLAIFAGLSVGQLLIGIELSADNNKLASTVFGDFDNDGDIDVVEISSASESVLFHEKSWNSFEKDKIPFSHFVPDLAGNIENNSNNINLFLLDENAGKYAQLSERGSEGFSIENSGSLDTPINEAILDDFDNDGDDDLVFSSSNGTIGWAKNNGTEGFNLQGNLITDLHSDVSSLDLIDYDSDGDTDIKLTQGGLAQLYKNNGSEGFVPDPNYNSTDDYHFHQNDINGDGFDDSMSVSNNGFVAVNKSQGSEGFSTQNSNLQNNVGTSSLHDLDDDGDLDLVYATPNGLAWAKNEGSDAFTPQSTIHETDSAIESFNITDADYDGDEDIYFSESNKIGFGLLKNNGSENFELQSFRDEVVGPQSLEPSLSMDVDGDGDTDIISAPGDTDYIEVHQNDSLSWQTTNSEQLPFKPDAIGQTDLDGDGLNDLLALNQSTGEIVLLNNQGSEGFSTELSQSLNSPVNHAVLADLDSDGDHDLVFADNSGLAWAKNQGSEGFSVQGLIANSNTDISAIELHDLDGDGDHDIFYATQGNGVVNILKNQESDGFVAQQVNSGLTEIKDLKIGDIDGDGDSDLIFASAADSKIGFAQNNGSDGFIPSGNLASNITQVDQIEIADLDGDSDLDIVAASEISDDSFWLQNNGSDGFIPHQLG